MITFSELTEKEKKGPGGPKASLLGQHEILSAAYGMRARKYPARQIAFELGYHRDVLKRELDHPEVVADYKKSSHAQKQPYVPPAEGNPKKLSLFGQHEVLSKGYELRGKGWGHDRITQEMGYSDKPLKRELDDPKNIEDYNKSSHAQKQPYVPERKAHYTDRMTDDQVKRVFALRKGGMFDMHIVKRVFGAHHASLPRFRAAIDHPDMQKRDDYHPPHKPQSTKDLQMQKSQPTPSRVLSFGRMRNMMTRVNEEEAPPETPKKPLVGAAAMAVRRRDIIARQRAAREARYEPMRQQHHEMIDRGLSALHSTLNAIDMNGTHPEVAARIEKIRKALK